MGSYNQHESPKILVPNCVFRPSCTREAEFQAGVVEIAWCYSSGVGGRVKPDSFGAGSEETSVPKAALCPSGQTCPQATENWLWSLGVPPSSPCAHNDSSGFLLQAQHLGLGRLKFREHPGQAPFLNMIMQDYPALHFLWTRGNQIGASQTRRVFPSQCTSFTHTYIKTRH